MGPDSPKWYSRTAEFIIRSTVVGIAFAGTAYSQVAIASVVNAASFRSYSGIYPPPDAPAVFPSGGALATLFCTGIKTGPGTYTAQSSSPLPFTLGGIRVWVNGGQAPLLAVVIPSNPQDANAQINFQVPIERNAAPQGTSEIGEENIAIEVTSADGFVTATVNNAIRGEGGFFADANGYVIAQHASDFSPVTVENPAHAGEAIIVYGDDFFEVWPPPAIGFPIPAQPTLTYNPSLGDAGLLYTGQYLYLQAYPSLDPKGNSYTNMPPLQVLFEGLAPGLIGVEQINFVVPANQAPGDWPLFFNVASAVVSALASSSSYAKLPVR